MSVFQVSHPDVPVKVASLFKKFDPSVDTKVSGLYLFRMVDIIINKEKVFHLPKDTVHTFFKKVCVVLATPYLRAEVNCDAVHFNLIMDYIYTGSLEIPTGQLIEFNESVTKLGVESLMQEIAGRIEFGSMNEMIDAFDNAIALGNTFMTETCVKKFIESARETFLTVDTKKIYDLIQKFPLEMLNRVLAGIKPYSICALDAFQMLNQWAKINLPMDSELAKLKKHIRFDSIKPTDLVTIVKPACLITDQEYMAIMEAKLMDMKLHKQIYLCNVRSPIPEGYRMVTDEEALTKEFQKNFIWNYVNGFEFISDSISKNGFILTSSGKTVEISKGEYHGCVLCNHIKENDSKTIGVPEKMIQLSLYTYAHNSTDSYMYVRI